MGKLPTWDLNKGIICFHDKGPLSSSQIHICMASTPKHDLLFPISPASSRTPPKVPALCFLVIHPGILSAPQMELRYILIMLPSFSTSNSYSASVQGHLLRKSLLAPCIRHLVIILKKYFLIFILSTYHIYNYLLSVSLCPTRLKAVTKSLILCHLPYSLHSAWHIVETQ